MAAKDLNSAADARAVPADAAQPPLRGDDPRPVRRGSVPGPAAPLDRPGGRAPSAAARPLEDATRIMSTHRGHHHCLAKGARAGRLMAELLGRADRLLARPRRLDARRRSREIGLLGTNGDRRRRHPDRDRRGASGCRLEERRRRRLLLRRGRGRRRACSARRSTSPRSGSCRSSSSARTTSYAELTPQPTCHVAGEIWRARRRYGIAGRRASTATTSRRSPTPSATRGRARAAPAAARR